MHILTYYQVNRPTALRFDPSRAGVGAVQDVAAGTGAQPFSYLVQPTSSTRAYAAAAAATRTARKPARNHNSRRRAAAAATTGSLGGNQAAATTRGISSGRAASLEAGSRRSKRGMARAEVPR